VIPVEEHGLDLVLLELFLKLDCLFVETHQRLPHSCPFLMSLLL
jgi:hypothetical protein